MNTKEALTTLLDNTRNKLYSVGVQSPSEALVLLTAKELNLVVGKRGRDGGCFATDAGVAMLGLDLATFRTAEAQERELVRAERARNKKNSSVEEEATKGV